MPNRADDPGFVRAIDEQTRRSGTNPYNAFSESEYGDRRDVTQEIDMTELELMNGDIQVQKVAPRYQLDENKTTEEAAHVLEKQAAEAERQSADELIRRAGRLDGVDPRLVRAAHTLDSEKRRTKSMKAAELLRDKSENLEGIDPRLLRAAAKLEEAKVHDPSRGAIGKGADSANEQSKPSDSVISFLSPPTTKHSSDVLGFPENRKQGVRPVKTLPPPPPSRKRR
jgi:hypothetical protein